MLNKYQLSILSFLAVLFVSFSLYGQDVIYIEQNIESSGMEMLDQPLESLTRSWITEQKVRIEQPDQIMLILFDKKKVQTLIPSEKQFIEMTFEEMDQLLNLSNMLMEATNKNEVVFAKFGEAKKMKDWSAYLIKAETETGIINIWLSEDVKMDRDALLKVYQKIPGMASFVSSMEKSMQFPGFPVLTKIEMEIMGMEIKTSIELLKAEKRSFNEELFKIPKDFEQIENPLKMLDEE